MYQFNIGSYKSLRIPCKAHPGFFKRQGLRGCPHPPCTYSCITGVELGHSRLVPYWWVRLWIWTRSCLPEAQSFSLRAGSHGVPSSKSLEAGPCNLNYGERGSWGFTTLHMSSSSRFQVGHGCLHGNTFSGVRLVTCAEIWVE